MLLVSIPSVAVAHVVHFILSLHSSVRFDGFYKISRSSAGESKSKLFAPVFFLSSFLRGVVLREWQ